MHHHVGRSKTPIGKNNLQLGFIMICIVLNMNSPCVDEHWGSTFLGLGNYGASIVKKNSTPRDEYLPKTCGYGIRTQKT
jgi:hypothetical protein